jgi:hypothetical protein
VAFLLRRKMGAHGARDPLELKQLA